MPVDYFVVDKRQDVRKQSANAAVVGPLGECEFRRKATQLKLPAITRVLAALK